MLARYLCEICSRGCQGSYIDVCTKHPALNIGSGLMLNKRWINYDMQELKHGDMKTDIIGQIEDIATTFKENTFAEIYCVHVIEHFRPPAGRKIIQDCFYLLRKGGILIMEGPDVLGMYWLFTSHPQYKGNIKYLIDGLYGRQEHYEVLGREWGHRWGYTVHTMADLMRELGFKIRHTGIGMHHGMGKRDFRVEGVK